jgi:hypothetical protein
MGVQLGFTLSCPANIRVALRASPRTRIACTRSNEVNMPRRLGAPIAESVLVAGGSQVKSSALVLASYACPGTGTALGVSWHLPSTGARILDGPPICKGSVFAAKRHPRRQRQAQPGRGLGLGSEADQPVSLRMPTALCSRFSGAWVSRCGVGSKRRVSWSGVRQQAAPEDGLGHVTMLLRNRRGAAIRC